MPVLPGAEPFVHDGSDDIGVLLCHGFTGTPQSMRDWGEHLAADGITVRCPRLPGHGTDWRDLNRTGWADWYAAVDRELAELSGRCRSVFAFGLSMGGTLTLRLAQNHPELSGIVLVNPSVTTLRRDAFLLPALSRVVPSIAGVAGDIAKPGAVEVGYDRTPLRAAASLQRLWRLVRGDLGRVRQPVLLMRSATDHVVEPVNSRIVLDGIRSGDVTEVVLRDSFHVATLDHDAPSVFAGSVEFVHRIHRERVEEPA
ncbi:alpha/beta fold hydrolase [Saccharopolyspora sp. NFXS83]|uniref:alpha/beta hydrolase n=1 Tax=Saccharopolyspora sp. NFXS83 TaxID=2993560 RepID=UPI00224AC044|nr:alpha/beta fold hydrolase [Saccharopolyspora sp. NFXS83]MCX2731002.1 alpha/beta fold hydrolase [Saccharopolyspora sp. NFXS83]